MYISSAIASITIALLSVNGVSLGYPPPAPVTQNIACPTGSSGCSVAVSGVEAAVGSNLYQITTYVQPGGIGTPSNPIISSGLVAVAVTSGGTVNTTLGDPTKLALGGYVASLGVSVTESVPFTYKQAGTGTVLIVAKDAAGATIVGNVQFPDPVTVSATGATLSGPGLQSDGSVVLTSPQTSSTLIALAYSGTSTSISVTAEATAAGGTPISGSASPPVVVPPPSASNSLYVLNAGNDQVTEFALATGGTVGMPATFRRAVATPVVAGQTGCPSTLTYDSDPNAGSSGYLGFGVNGISVDAKTGNVYFAQTGNTCNPSSPEPAIFSFGSSATGAAGATTYPLSPPNGDFNLELGDVELSFDSVAGELDSGWPPTLFFIDGNGNQNAAFYAQVAFSGASSSVTSIGGFDASGGTQACADSAGLTGGVAAFPGSCAAYGSSGYLGGSYGPTVYGPEQGGAVFQISHPAIAASQSGVVFATAWDSDSQPFVLSKGSSPASFFPVNVANSYDPLLGSSPAVIGFSSGQPNFGIATAQPSWIEGPDTLLSPWAPIASIAYDASTHRLFVLTFGFNVNGQFYYASATGTPLGSPARPDLCTDAGGNPGTSITNCSDADAHFYITAYDVTQLSGGTPAASTCAACAYPPGAIDLKPVLVISGDKLHLPPVGMNNGLTAPGFGQNVLPQNALAAFGGRVYLANPLGAACNATCATNYSANGLPTGDGTGEIDVYDGTQSGYYGNSNPGAVFLGAFTDPNLNTPISVAVGPLGTATSSPANRVRGIAPHNLRSQSYRHRPPRSMNVRRLPWLHL